MARSNQSEQPYEAARRPYESTRKRRTFRVGALLLAPALVTALGVAVACAGDGAQFAGACDRTYVNKQIGDTEQWAISWEIYGNATGNVFKLDGSAPSFIECSLVDEDGGNEIFDCYGSSPCRSEEHTSELQSLRLLV